MDAPLLPTPGVAQASPPTVRAARIGIEAGHGVGDPGSISCDGKVREADVTLGVAQRAAALLREQGHTVDIFRGNEAGTLPKSQITGYKADAFFALHTDFCAPGNSGFKVTRFGGAPVTGMIGTGDPSDRLTDAVWKQFGVATGLPEDRGHGHFTPNMRFYWAINPNWNVAWSTPAVIVEMGWLSGDKAFMSSPDGQQRMGTGIANAVTHFLGGTVTPAEEAAAAVIPATAQEAAGG